MTGIGFTAVVRATGVTVRQLDYWTRHGVFDSLGIEPLPGSGNRRIYPKVVVDLCLVLKHLAALGATTDVLTAVVGWLPHVLAAETATIVVSATGGYVVAPHAYPAGWYLNLGHIISRMEEP